MARGARWSGRYDQAGSIGCAPTVCVSQSVTLGAVKCPVSEPRLRHTGSYLCLAYSSLHSLSIVINSPTVRFLDNGIFRTIHC